MEKRYYTVTDDGRAVVWWQGYEPVMLNPFDEMTGDTYGFQQLFREFSMTYVPWEVVQILSGV